MTQKPRNYPPLTEKAVLEMLVLMHDKPTLTDQEWDEMQARAKEVMRMYKARIEREQQQSKLNTR